jgi:PUA domain protein
MMKKFSKELISSQTKVKASVQRGILAKLNEQFPALEPYMEDILPKKAGIVQVKCQGYITLITVNKEILFFQERDGPFFPSLRLLHKYPFMLPKVTVDTGAIKHILGGSDIMCRGMTSAGGKLDEDFAVGAVVAIMAQDKEHALGVGVAAMTRDDIKKINDGKGVLLGCALDDGLWHYPALDH